MPRFYWLKILRTAMQALRYLQENRKLMNYYTKPCELMLRTAIKFVNSNGRKKRKNFASIVLKDKEQEPSESLRAPQGLNLKVCERKSNSSGLLNQPKQKLETVNWYFRPFKNQLGNCSTFYRASYKNNIFTIKMLKETVGNISPHSYSVINLLKSVKHSYF